jgi:type II secretory pathway component HofQ
MSNHMLKFLLIVSLLMLCLGGGWQVSCLAADGNGAGQPLVTATFFESDLREALSEVSLRTKVNITVDNNVNGTISLELKDVPLEDALYMMLVGGGYTFRKIKDFYLVGLPNLKNPVFTELTETGVYHFQNVQGNSIKTLIPEPYSPYVKVDTEKNMATAIAPPTILRRILDDLAKIDGPKRERQFRIKALVTEVQNQVLKEWGMNSLTAYFDGTDTGKKNFALDLTSGILSGEGDASFGHFVVAIQALVNEKKAVINSDPTVIVTEGKTGNLFVGDRRTLILQSEGSSSTTSSTENVEAGTTLQVTPRLFGDDIELTFTQKVNVFDDTASTTNRILVRTREYSSVVRFLSGQTVLVAGLTEKQTNNNSAKAPLLGDIPLIGLLFKQQSDQKSNSELLIFLTAEVINQ